MSRRLGVEWTGTELRGVEVRPDREGAEVVATAAVSWAPGEEPAGEAVRALLAEGGFAADAAVLAVSGDAAVIKALALPPLPPPALVSVLRQEEDRYFLLPRGRRCYGVFGGPAAPGEGAAESRWAVAAPAEQLEELVGALEAEGVFVRGVAPSAGLYGWASRRLVPGLPVSGRVAVLRATADGAEWVEYGEGGAIRARELGAHPEVAGRAGAPAEAGVPVVLLLDPEVPPPPLAEEAEEGPAEGTIFRTPQSGRLARAGTFAGAFAAAVIGPQATGVPDLLPPGVAEARRRRSRRLTGALAAAVALLVLLTGYLVDRERDRREAALELALREARAEAAPVLAARDELEEVVGQLTAFQAAREARIPYSGVLARLAEALPEGAWIVSFVAQGEEGAVLTGYAPAASDVVTALSGMAALEEVRFQQPTRKVRVGGRELESFTLAVSFSPQARGGLQAADGGGTAGDAQEQAEETGATGEAEAEEPAGGAGATGEAEQAAGGAGGAEGAR